MTWDGSDDELLDVRQAAALLTLKPSTLSAWARDGRVPVIRLGPRAHRWTRPLLREIRKRRSIGAASDWHVDFDGLFNRCYERCSRWVSPSPTHRRANEPAHATFRTQETKFTEHAGQGTGVSREPLGRQ